MQKHNILFKNQDVPIEWWIGGNSSPPVVPNEEDPYSTLYLTKNAPLSVVKAVYKQLVKELHPDLGGDKEKFLVLQDAYSKICK